MEDNGLVQNGSEAVSVMEGVVEGAGFLVVEAAVPKRTTWSLI